MENAEFDRRFGYHPPTDDLVRARHGDVRLACKDAASIIDVCVPDGREKSLAFTKLEEAMMWANAGLARNTEDGPPS